MSEHKVKIQEFENEYVSMLLNQIEGWMFKEDQSDIIDISIRQRDGVYFARIFYYEVHE